MLQRKGGKKQNKKNPPSINSLFKTTFNQVVDFCEHMNTKIGKGCFERGREKLLLILLAKWAFGLVIVF